MEIIEGKVSNYKGHGDIFRFYGKIGEEIKYYFLDFSPLSNGNMIATTELVEAIDSEVPASHIGLVDSEGNVVIPLENKSIKPITGDILLVERLNPLSQNVVDAIAASKDTKLATGLVSITNTCKNRVMEKLGVASELVFHNQLSEASIFDINGNNLVNGEYFSYIGINAEKIYLGKNVVDAPITEYSMLPSEVQANTIVNEGEEVNNDINVENALNNSEEIKDSVEGEIAQEEVVQNEQVTETPVAPVENPESVEADVAPTEATEEAPAEVPVEAPVQEEVPVAPEEAVTPEVAPQEGETPTEEVPAETAPEGMDMFTNTEAEAAVNNNEGFNDVDIPEVPVENVPVQEETPVETPVAPLEEASIEAPVENTEVGTISPEEVANETSEINYDEINQAQAEVPQKNNEENVVSSENGENIDDVLNSLFGTLGKDEPPVEAPVVPAEVSAEVPAAVVNEPVDEPVEEEKVEETEEQSGNEENLASQFESQNTEEQEESDFKLDIPVVEDNSESKEEEKDKIEEEFVDDSNNYFELLDSESNDNNEYGFSDFKADKIEKNDDYDFGSDYNEVDTYSNYNDNLYDDYNSMDSYNNDREDVLSSAGKVMSNLINLNKRQKSDISRLNSDLNKANNVNRAKSEQIDMLENKLNSASNKVRNLDTVVSKLESKNTMLSSKVDDQKRLIDSQTRELNSKDREIEELRRQLQGKDELAKFVADAQSLLEQDRY